MRCREIMRWTGFTGKEQPVVDRSGQCPAAIRHARARVRIRAARIRIGAPAVDSNGLDPFLKSAAEQARQLGNREVEERVLASRLKLSRQPPTEIRLDLRAAKR